MIVLIERYRRQITLLLVKLLSDHTSDGLIIKVHFMPTSSFAPNVIFPSAKNGGAKTSESDILT